TLAAAGIGATTAALTVVALTGIPVPVAFATGGAFGWYTLAGPLVTRAAGPELGLMAFLANFLREVVTIALAPWIGRKLGGDGLAALGGATAMDTTLYSVTRWGSKDAGSLALVSGLLLTVTAGILVPLVLSLG
ncbi:MAG: lysine exporter LysO family protein, partial [Thermoplasmata archaeon]|nr:lysine exporter LysO family protein [Thermoplasmata archaeon]